MRRYRRPTNEEAVKIFFKEYELEELFYFDEVEEFLTVAYQAIAGEFYYAVEVNPRFKLGSNNKLYRGTDNYIIGVGGRPSDLASYIAKSTHRKIVPAKRLPDGLSDLVPKLVDKIVSKARGDIVLLAVNAMAENGEIRYDEALGTWNICQSNVDSFLCDKAMRSSVKRAMKYDDRAWHGRPRRDRGKVPTGISVSHG